MKLSEKMSKYGIVIALIFVIITTILMLGRNKNIVYYMKNGLENPDILQYYKEDIENVETMTNGTIKIRYYDIDLNEDGMDDKIVYIRSPLHTGSHGDSFTILLNEGSGYTKILTMAISLYYQDVELTPIGEVYIMKDKTNGFHDIKVSTDEYRFFLKYENGRYQYVRMENEL